MAKRAPDGSPLIDFDIVASVVPLALAGTLVGVWINSRVQPEIIVFILIGPRRRHTRAPKPGRAGVHHGEGKRQFKQFAQEHASAR